MLNIGEIVKGYNRSARGFTELVPYMAMWDPQTIATIDQGMLALYEYDGLDAEGRSDAENDFAVEAYESAFNSFGAGATLWSFIDRRKTDLYPTQKFNEPVGQFIDDTWRSQITSTQYENRYTLAIHQRAQEGSMALFDAVDLIVKEEGVGLGTALWKALSRNLSLKGRRGIDERKMRSANDRLTELCNALETGMKPLGLRRLSSERLLAELYNRLSPASPRREKMEIPEIPAYLGNLLPSDTLRRTSNALIFQNEKTKYVGVVSLKGFAENSSTVIGQLDWLTSIQGEISLSHCFRFIDRDVAEKTIDDIERYNISKSVPFFHRVITTLGKTEPTKFNDGRLALAADAKDARVDIYQNNRAFGHHNLTVLCFGDTLEEMQWVRKQVIDNLTHSRFVGHVERMHQLSAFTQTIPGQWASGVRWNFISFGNAADIAPIRTINRGATSCAHFEKELKRPFAPLLNAPTTSGAPVSIDLWENGVGHMKVIGPTRAGKSTITNFLLTQFRKYEPCRTIVIDKDYSCKVATLLQDGVHVDLNRDAKNSTRISPMSLCGDDRHHPFLVGWIMELIEAGRNELQCSPAEIDLITRAVRGLSELPRDKWRLSYLSPSLGPELGAYLNRWTQGGSDGNWFDNEPVELETGQHICFECKELYADKTVARLAMSYLFYVIERLLDDTPTIVSIEETWFFLDEEVFSKKIDNFLRTLGKRNASLWIVTQTAKEIDDSPIRNSILANIPNSIYLPDRHIRENAELYQRVTGLLPEEISRISSATEKKHYYIKTPSVSRMLDMELPQEIVVMLSSSSRARATFQKYYDNRKNDPDWKGNYFKEMTNAI